MIGHILLTRFNIRAKYSNRADYLWDEWLYQRLRIFNTITRPSVDAATKPEYFFWVILIDERTPDWLKEALPPIKYIYNGCTSEVEEREKLDSYLLSLVPLATKIITTRLDSDDAVSKHHFEVVGSHAEGVASCYINLLHGVQMKNGKFYDIKLPSNCFLSKVSEPGDFSSVFDINHTIAQDRFDYKEIDTPLPMWLMNIHKGNVSNKLSGYKKIDLPKCYFGRKRNYG